MAFTSIISYTLTDFAGKAGNVAIYVPAGLTVAQMQAFSDVAAQALDNVTGAVITAAHASVALTLPGTLKAGATPNMNSAEGVNIIFTAANTAYRHTHRVPAVLDSVLVGNMLNLAANEPGEIYTEVLVGGSGGVSPSDEYANDLTSAVSGIKTFRKR